MKKLSSRLLDRYFLLKIFLPVVLTLGLFIIALYRIVIPRFEEIVLDRKREMIRELTHSVWHIAETYRQEAVSGRITEAEAKRWTIEQVRRMRYGDERKDYFWITDFQPVMIVHPFRNDLNGADLSEVRDSRGKKLFVEMVNTVRTSGSGYVDYMWQWKDDSTRIVPKLSYVEPFAPWGWIIGTGIYLEDVTIEIARLERSVIDISIAITIAVSLLLLFIAMQNLGTERRRRRAEGELRESKEKYEALVEASTEGFLMIVEGEPVYCNRTLFMMAGLTDTEADPHRIFDILPNAIRTDVVNASTGAEENVDATEHWESELRRSDGTHFPALFVSSRIEFYGRSGVMLIVKDISHQRTIVSALDESRERFVALTNRLSMAVFRTDCSESLHFVEVNAAAVRMFGAADEQSLLSTDFAALFTELHTFDLLHRELFSTGFVKERIARLKRLDGATISASISVALVRDDDGIPCWCDCIVDEISAHLKSEMDAHTLISELQAPLAFLQETVESFVFEASSCRHDDSLEQAATLLARRGAESALFVTDADGRRIAWISREDVMGPGLQGDAHVYEVMHAPLHTIATTASVFELLSHHRQTTSPVYAVRDERGILCGFVSIADVARAQLRSYLFILNRLGYADSIAEVRHCHDAAMVHVRLLIASGAGVTSVTRATTAIADAIVRRCIALAEEELGPSPVRFAFLALGSDGRREQSLVTDQDNALLYDDPKAGEEESVREYFARLATRVCDALDAVGYRYCKGEVMAKNPKWCQPFSRWKSYFAEWITTANPQDLLEVNIFFDFRTAYGDEELTENLRRYVFDITKGNHAFFLYLVQNALQTRTVKFAEAVDIKSAMLPIVDLVRIHALKNSVHTANTLDRLAALREKNVFSVSGQKDIAHAFAFLHSMRFRHQADLCAENATPNNTVDTNALSEIERATLRRVLSLIDDFKSKLSLDFKGTL